MYIDLVTINLCPGQSGGGVKPSGILEISENGEYDVYSYASASVDVHPSTSLSETYISNGNYNITGEFNGGVIKVDVPAPQFVTETLNVSVNGTYTPGQGVDGYSQVVVDVPQSVTGYTQKEITEGRLNIVNLNNSASYVKIEAFKNDKTIQTVNLPYAISVGDYAFQGCSSLTQVSLPVCSQIYYGVFSNCTSLTQVSLPVCSSIGNGAFINCISLTQIDLPMCSYISDYAFRDCSSLTQVSLPMCSRIGSFAFSKCRSLKSIDLPMCSYIGGYAFISCSSLSQVNLPMCSYIAISTFNNCYSLSQVSLPKCSYIGVDAFWGCSLLTQVSLPMCSRIDSWAFEDCSSLSIITIGYSSVCGLSHSNAFSNTQITSSTGSIYVPTSLVDSYKSATNWSIFSTQIFPISE